MPRSGGTVEQVGTFRAEASHHVVSGKVSDENVPPKDSNVLTCLIPGKFCVRR